MKEAFVKDRKEFDKVAPEYGFVKKYIGEIYEQWYKRIGKVEIYIFVGSNRVRAAKNGVSGRMGKGYIEKYIEDISHLIEWK